MCLYFFLFDPFQRLGQKSVKEKVQVLEDLKTQKNHSEIKLPLDKYVFGCHWLSNGLSKSGHHFKMF